MYSVWGKDLPEENQMMVDIWEFRRVMFSLGGYTGLGFANGIAGQIKNVITSASKLAKTAFSTIKAATTNNKYEKAGASAIKAYESGMKKTVTGVKASAQHLVNLSVAELSRRTPAAASEYSAFGKKLMDSFTKGFQAEADAAVKKVKTKIEALTEETQKAYDEIIKNQTAFQKKLAGYGGIYSNSEGITDLKATTKEIEAYAKNLDRLKKKGISKDLLADIVDMNIEDAAQLSADLLKMSDKKLKEYNTAYVKQQAAAKKIAKEYYKDQITDLQKNFTAKVKTQLAALQTDLKKIGQDAVAGLLKGINSKNITGDLKKFTDSIVAQIKKNLKIKSPSRVMEDDVGAMIPKGTAKGIDKNIGVVKDSMSDLADVTLDEAKKIEDSLPQLSIDAIDLSKIDASAIVAKMQAAVYTAKATVGAAITATVNHQISGMEQENKKIIDYVKLGDEVANSLVRAGVTMEVDNWTFGKLVREVQ